jgi:hypothetical protein
MTPTVSAYAYLWGQHDYNANSVASLGCIVEAYLYPGIQETWAPHTASGYYLRNLQEHYQYHKIYICDIRHNQVCDTVIFKHKCLTMPTITPADAPLKASEKLVGTISGVILKNSVTKDAVLQLMSIYHQQALDAADTKSAQRVLRRLAKAQQLQTEKEDAKEQRVVMPQAPTSPDIGIFEVEHPIDTDPSDIRDAVQQPNSITQGDNDSPMASNTRQHRQGSISQDYMLHMIKQPGDKSPFTSRQASSRKYPLQFLCDLAYAILDKETGNLLKYRH